MNAGPFDGAQIGSRLPERTHVVVNGNLLEAVEVRVESVTAACDHSVLGIQRDVADLLELVPDKRQRVDKVGVLAADSLTVQFSKRYTCRSRKPIIRRTFTQQESILIKVCVRCCLMIVFALLNFVTQLNMT